MTEEEMVQAHTDEIARLLRLRGSAKQSLLVAAAGDYDCLREINAELLAALKMTSQALRVATGAGRSIYACRSLDASDAAITRAEAGK